MTTLGCSVLPQFSPGAYSIARYLSLSPKFLDSRMRLSRENVLSSSARENIRTVPPGGSGAMSDRASWTVCKIRLDTWATDPIRALWSGTREMSDPQTTRSYGARASAASGSLSPYPYQN